MSFSNHIGNLSGLSNATGVVKYIHSDIPPAFYYSIPYQVLGTIAALIILAVGLSGNLLVITVIIWSSKMRTTTNIYLVSLSFSDMLFLLHATAPMLWELYVMVQQWTLGIHACRWIVAVQYLSVDASALSMAAFSVERWVAICHPMRAQTLCSVTRALKIITGIWIFCAAYNLMWLFIADTKTVIYRYGTYEQCTFKYNRVRYGTVYLLDFILFYAIPLGLVFVMYTQITLRLFKFPRRPIWLSRQAKDESDGSGKMVSRARRTTLQRMNVGDPSFISDRVGARAFRYRKQVVKMLMSVVVLFAIFWFPYRTWVVYNSFATKPHVDYWFGLFARMMAYLNSAVNPILYNAMSKKFRRCFRTFLTKASCFVKPNFIDSRRSEFTRVGAYRNNFPIAKHASNDLNESLSYPSHQ